MYIKIGSPTIVVVHLETETIRFSLLICIICQPKAETNKKAQADWKTEKGDTYLRAAALYSFVFRISSTLLGSREGAGCWTGRGGRVLGSTDRYLCWSLMDAIILGFCKMDLNTDEILGACLHGLVGELEVVNSVREGSGRCWRLRHYCYYSYAIGRVTHKIDCTSTTDYKVGKWCKLYGYKSKIHLLSTKRIDKNPFFLCASFYEV